MDGCSSWLPFLGSGIGDGGVSSKSGLEVQQQKQDLPISSQVEGQLQQFYLPEVMVPSSESSMFSFFSASPDETSSLKQHSTTAHNPCHNPAPAEVSSSSQQIHLYPVTYYSSDDHQQCYAQLGTILNLDEFRCQEARNERSQAQHNGHGGAFMPYARHLCPKKKPKPGSGGGQRAIKAAMSAVARMHMVRLAQWRQCYDRYQMEMAVTTEKRRFA